jgi:hypothetical protein
MPQLRIVVVAMTWGLEPEMLKRAGQIPTASQPQHLMDSLDRMIARLQQHAKTVVVVGPIPVPGRKEASIVARQLAFHHAIDVPLFGSESTFMAQEGDAIEHYAARKDIIFIRPDSVLCNQEKCGYFHDGASLFAGDNHLAEAALPLFRTLFESALQQALAHKSSGN